MQQLFKVSNKISASHTHFRLSTLRAQPPGAMTFTTSWDNSFDQWESICILGKYHPPTRWLITISRTKRPTNLWHECFFLLLSACKFNICMKKVRANLNLTATRYSIWHHIEVRIWKLKQNRKGPQTNKNERQSRCEQTAKLVRPILYPCVHDAVYDT